MACPRCSAVCSCKKVRRKARKPRAKPMYAPPMPQQIIFNPTPAVRDAYDYPLGQPIRFDRSAIIPSYSVRSDYLPEGALPRKQEAATQAKPRTAEMEVQTDDIMLPFRGGSRPLQEIEARVAQGESLVIRHPSTGRPRGSGRSPFEGRTMPQPMEEVIGGGAAGGGEAPLPSRYIRRKPKVAPGGGGAAAGGKKDD